MADKTLVQIQDLKMYFENRKGWFGKQVEYVKAVDGVSLDIKKGETVGLVGESGCGKSSCARTIIRIYDPTDGQILLDGQDITHMRQRELKPLRKKMQMIFQDPYASLNARMTVRDIIAEPLLAHGIVKKKDQANDIVYPMLERVGLTKEHANRYAHEFSGGQRQRVGIARALVLQPELVICDEPISALDVSIQAQVINLLNDLRHKLGLTILFIAHDLSVVKYFSDRIGVMYFGKMVELATSDELFAHPLHPYTKSLLSAIPLPDPHYEKQRKRIKYEPLAEHDYSVDKPSMREVAPGHFVHCNDAEFARYQAELKAK